MNGEFGDDGKQGGEFFVGPDGKIPKRLRDYYQTLEDEALPDRFLKLLDELELAEKAVDATNESLECKQ